jgi:hypothetical protein
MSEDPRGVPDMIIHGFFKNMTLPTKAEGFSEVVSIPIAPTMLNSAMEAFMYTGFLEG